MTYPSDASSTYRPDSPATYAGNEAPTPPGFGPHDGSDASTTDVAKEQAAAVGDTAAQAGQHVVEVAKDEVANVAEQAKYEARNLFSHTREELNSQASTQQERAAGGLHALSAELETMASRSDSDGPATHVVREAADRVSSAATWLDNREPGQVLSEIQMFARQRPGAFLAIAAAAGLLVGRLTRGLAADPGAGSGATVQGQATTGHVPGNGWQQSGAAAYGTGLDPALAYNAPPSSTAPAGWTGQQFPPVPVSPGPESSYPATPEGGYPAPGEGTGYPAPGQAGGYSQSGPSRYPAPGAGGVGR